MADEEEKTESPTKALTAAEEDFIQAIENNNFDEVKKQLNRLNDINFTDRNMSTPLFHSCSSAQIEISRFLVANGARLDAQNERGNTPLHIACDKGSIETILHFLLYGADNNAKNADGKRAEELNYVTRAYVSAIVKDRDSFKTCISNEQNKRLTGIFEEIDNNKAKYIDLDKATRFNCFVEDLDKESGTKDAEEFLRDVSISNPERVNIDEWLFSFAKLSQENGGEAIDAFIEEFDKRVKEKGRFSDFKLP